MKYEGKIENDALVLRPLLESDIEQVRLWRNSNPIRKWFINDSVINRNQQIEWFNRYLQDDSEMIFIIEEKDESQALTSIGMVSIYNINQQKKIAEFGKLFIGEEKARGKGYGKAVVKMICDFAFDYYQLMSIKLEVLEDNIRGINTYKKVGFKAYMTSIEADKKVIHMRLINHKYKGVNDRKKVLAFCYKTIPSAIVGVIEPLRYLSTNGYITFQYMDSQNINDDIIKTFDILVCIRGAEEKELEIVEKAKKCQKKVIYYLDDDLLNIDRTDTFNFKYFHDNKVIYNISKIMEMSQYFWTNNPILLYKYGPLFDEAFITDAPALLLREHGLKKPTNQKVNIGYAGGMDHRSFFEEILYEPMDKLLKSHGNQIEIEVLGFEPYYMHQFKTEFFPYIESYHQYKIFMHSRKWDIALAPLPNAPFYSCKYYNKLLEYGAIGAAGIYSNVSPFTLVIKDGINGLLVNNEVDAWYKAMVKLVEDVELREKISQDAEKLLKERFSLVAVANEIASKMKIFSTG